MEIKGFTVADLDTALRSEDFWLTKTLPITKHRALSFSRNPRADGNDLVLLVAYQDSLVIGYLGILPDNIFVNNTACKFGWLSSWWVDPNYASTGVGAILLFKALNAYQQQLGVSGGSKQARKALESSQRFNVIKTLKGLDVRLRINVTGAILRENPEMKIFRVLFRIFDVIADEITNIRGYLWECRNRIHPPLTFEYVSSIDEETDEFIQRHYLLDLTRRGKAEFDWMMSYPWILSAPIKDSTSRRYYFSSRSSRFSFLGVKVYAHDVGLVGFFILQLRDDRMSVLYSFFDSQHALSIAAAVVYHYLAMGVSRLSLYDEQLIARFSELRCPYWSGKAVSRKFFMSKAITDLSLQDCRIHGGDGDLAFY
jgi:hypothetical protein